MVLGAALAAALAPLAAACGAEGQPSGSSDGLDAGSGSGSGGSGRRAAVKAVSEAELTIVPKAGAENIDTGSTVRVEADRGRLKRVTVTASGDGAGGGTRRLVGSFGADRTTWESTERLTPGTRYSVHAVALDAKHLKAVEDSEFTTLSRAHTLIGYFTPEADSTVGAGMPLSINFNRPVQDRRSVQEALTVTASSGVEVVGHWFGNQRLDFRPETYWPSGTRVTLRMRLRGVESSPGVFGTQTREMSFTVARQQVAVVDAGTKQMTVTRNGQLIKTIPISAGSPENPTYNGRMVIIEKYTETRMNGATVGFTDDDGKGEYDIPDVPHAMRLTTSGTFIHGNYWGDESVFGSANTSHGCVGLQDVKGGGKGGSKGAGKSATPAAWFFDNSLLGDVVEVRNSPDRTVKPENGLNGWNMDWALWKQGSAV
jgi:lipoprotein-anchoring transpeptidase ErfK/SrfK